MRSKRASFALPGVFLAGVLSVTGLHAEVDALVREAQELSTAGQGAKAYEMLEPQESQRAGDPDFDLAFGIAANQAAQYTRAIMALERLMALQPDNVRARTELGRALYGVGDNKAARKLLAEGQLNGITAVAGEPIDQLLHAIDRVEAEGNSSWRGYVEASAGQDSNINGAPGISSVAVPSLGGSILGIAPGGTKQSGGFGALAAGLSGRMVMDDPRWSLIGSVNVNDRQYGGSNDQYDTLQYDASAGVVYRHERNEFSLAAQFAAYDINHDRVRNASGVVGEWTYRPDGFRQVNAYVQLSRLAYPQQPISDADRSVVGVTYANLFRSGSWAYGGLYVGEEAERDSAYPYLGHKLAGVRAGVQYPLAPGLALFATAGYEERHFGGTDPTFLVSRRDHQFNAGVGLSWVPAEFWRVTPQYSYTNTRSNVPLAEYDKNLFSVTVRRDF